MKKNKKLTVNQEKLLYFIFKYRGQYGTAPTLREMVRELRVSDNKSILGIIESLTNKGFVQRERKKSRSIQLTDKAGDFLNGYIFPFNYQISLSAEKQLRQPAELIRNDVAILSPTSNMLSHQKGTIKTNGTSLGNDFYTIVETAVSLVINKYFKSPQQVEQTVKQGLTESIISTVHKALPDKTIAIIFTWGIIITALTWVNISIIENRLNAALIYSIIEVIIIKKFLIE